MKDTIAIPPGDPADRQTPATTILTRRRLLKTMGVLGISIPVSALLAACGSDNDDDPTATTENSSGSDSGATEEPAAADDPTEEPMATEENAATGGSTATMSDASTSEEVDLNAIKTFTLEQAELMKEATAELSAVANRYYDLVSASDFDYDAALAANPQELPGLVVAARESWITASTHYETDEGIVAGVPSLADYDVWIDAGPSGEEDPVEARDWQLELPNDEVLDKPGNIFHGLLEPALWGTKESAIGAELPEDSSAATLGVEVLPEANLFVASADALDGATDEMIEAISAWEPTLSDVFTAEVTMIPTMNEYFEQWKNSIYVAGAEDAEETAFVGVSRLFDINGILTGLDIAYQELSVAVATADPELDELILTGFADLLVFVGDLFEQEQAGELFTSEEADLLGTEAQDQATALAGYVAQAAALLNVELMG